MTRYGDWSAKNRELRQESDRLYERTGGVNPYYLNLSH